LSTAWWAFACLYSAADNVWRGFCLNAYPDGHACGLLLMVILVMVILVAMIVLAMRPATPCDAPWPETPDTATTAVRVASRRQRRSDAGRSERRHEGRLDHRHGGGCLQQLY